jgi:glycosyltransferase involved in cell wall biosynthesis
LRTAFVSTYPPRRCGIAMFTYDLATTVGEREIVVINPPGEIGPYPAEVRHRIRRDVQADYVYAAGALNDCGVDVVSLQHDFAIWGGEDGAYVLDFARALRIPAVLTIHALPHDPTPQQRRIVAELAERAAATIVMSRAAASELAAACGAEPARAQIVHQGVPHLPLVAPNTVKPRLGLAGRSVILSFGLLDPDKGLESVIAAMPAVVQAVPSACYVMLGATHPDCLRQHGEAYREALTAQVGSLGLDQHVRFVDTFAGRVELATWLEAADVLATPYRDLDRTVSGTLACGMAAGKAIVSTPFAYASEMLAGDRGALVKPGSTPALAAALIELLGDAEVRTAMGRRAYDASRAMVWSEVGAQYRRILGQAASVTRGAPDFQTHKLTAVSV